MLNDFTGKNVLVTGGTAGIGREIALTFARHGANVIIFGTNEERANGVVAEMRELGKPEQTFSKSIVDVGSLESVESALKEHGDIDVLINNAGITRDNLLMRMSEEQWDDVIRVNLKSAFNMCKVLVRSMMKKRAGKIINVTSVVGLNGNAGQTNYAASKAGLIGYSKSLAKELATRGITVNCIAPGFIETRMTDVLGDGTKEAILQQIPMKRMGRPEEIARAALFLAESDYITGQTLTVDGGMVM